jgi:hypothetical protein
METFQTNFKALDHTQRRAKLDQILGFLRQHNAHAQAEAFQSLRGCYPKFPLSKSEREFQEYLAWCEIAEHSGHRIVQHILSQG